MMILVMLNDVCCDVFMKMIYDGTCDAKCYLS